MSEPLKGFGRAHLQMQGALETAYLALQGASTLADLLAMASGDESHRRLSTALQKVSERLEESAAEFLKAINDPDTRKEHSTFGDVGPVPTD
mgnify:CR=1 FL=1